MIIYLITRQPEMMAATQNLFLETAYNIGIQLCRDAIWSGNKCNWAGPSMEYLDSSWKTVQRSYSTDLYSGTAGVGYFLSYLYSLTDDPIIKETALGCFEQAIANKEQIHTAARIGFYTGWSGIVHALQKCGPLLNKENFDKEATEMLNAIIQCNLQESGIDILAGCAGAIPVLISQRGSQNDTYLNFAKNIGSHLIEFAHKTDKGWSWNTLGSNSTTLTNNLTGFSHGTAGIAWALIELYEITKDEKYNDAAQKAFEYERSLFNAVFGNWPDLRSFDNTQKTTEELYGSVAWCHGAPGIGLSRLRAYDLSSKLICKEEAEIAVKTTSNSISQMLQNRVSNFSLCHGIGGNTEVLILGADILENNEFLNYAKKIGLAGITLYSNNGTPWPCGIMGAGESPGLMLGLAGIGYFYLRLHDQKRVPSILLPLSN
jgi:type 2 lantibiotic biosynthesis protein LanM